MSVRARRSALKLPRRSPPRPSMMSSSICYEARERIDHTPQGHMAKTDQSNETGIDDNVEMSDRTPLHDTSNSYPSTSKTQTSEAFSCYTQRERIILYGPGYNTNQARCAPQYIFGPGSIIDILENRLQTTRSSIPKPNEKVVS